MNITPTLSPPIASGVQSGNRNDVSTTLRQAEIGKGSAATQAIAPDQAVTPNQETEAVGNEKLDEAVKQVNEFVATANSSLEFSVDEDTGRSLVKLIDVQTKEVIRQIPSEEMLNIAKALDKLQGLLIQNKA